MPGKVSTHKDRSNVGSSAVAGETREALSHGAGGWGTLEARETFAVSDLPLRTLRAIPAKWVGVAGADVPGSGDGEATGGEEVASYFLLLRCGVVWLIVVARLVDVGIGGRVPSVVVTASAVLSAWLMKSIVLATSTPRMTAILRPPDPDPARCGGGGARPLLQLAPESRRGCCRCGSSIPRPDPRPPIEAAAPSRRRRYSMNSGWSITNSLRRVMQSDVPWLLLSPWIWQKNSGG